MLFHFPPNLSNHQHVGGEEAKRLWMMFVRWRRDSGQLLWKEMKIQGSWLAFRMKMKKWVLFSIGLVFCSSFGLTIHSWKTFASKANVNYHNEKQTDIWQSRWQCLLNFNEVHIWWKHCKSLKNRLFLYRQFSPQDTLKVNYNIKVNANVP